MLQLTRLWQGLSEDQSYYSTMKFFLLVAGGPLFFILSSALLLLKFTPQHSLLLFLSIFSVFSIWGWGMRGTITSISVFTVLLIYNFRSLPLWEMGWFVSLVLGLFITSFMSDEVKKHFAFLKKHDGDLSEEIALWKERFATVEKKMHRQIEELQEENSTLEKDIEIEKGHIQSLKRLVEVAHLESIKNAKQNATLREENLRVKQKIAQLQQEAWVLIDSQKERLNHLNGLRAQEFQKDLLIDQYRKES